MITDKSSNLMRFDYAVNIILEHEGGYTNDADDPGEETKFGITNNDLKIYAKQLDFPLDVTNISRSQAINFYEQVFWNKYHYNEIHSLSIATKIFDMAVDMGAHEAHELLQRALSYCGYTQIKVDGILGIQTIEDINEVCLHGRESDLMYELIEEAKYFYEQLVKEKPILNKFLKGWLARASWS